MGTVSDLITEIQQSFDVTPADALTVLDRRHKQMCDAATWWRESRSLTTFDAPLTGAVSLITLPTDIVELFYLQAYQAGPGGEDVIYSRTMQRDLAAMNAGTLVLAGPGGVFYEHAPTGNTFTSPTTNLLLYPEIAAGSTVFAVGAYVPPTLNPDDLAFDGGFIRFPADFHSQLLAGVYADLLNRPNEARPDLANVQEGLFQQGVAQLRERADRRYRTKGPRQIRVGAGV